VFTFTFTFTVKTMPIKHLILVIAAAAFASTSHAQQFFRIGVGSATGTYYRVGSMIANNVSKPGVVVTAQASNGSVANVISISNGTVESAFSQADVAAWAYRGEMSYEGKPKLTELRMIANLYPESIHIVVKKNSGIKTVGDLMGKRVALDESESGSLIHARMVLAAYGVKESDLKAEYIKPNQAGEKLKNGALDAFFFTGGAPAGAITELANAGIDIELVPLVGLSADGLRLANPYFSVDTIPTGTYKNISAVQTLSVNAQFITSNKVDAETVYQLTKAMFTQEAQKNFQKGHVKGKLITVTNAVQASSIPFHRGAERYYKEVGVMK
jgi:uncharacterized protein